MTSSNIERPKTGDPVTTWPLRVVGFFASVISPIVVAFFTWALFDVTRDQWQVASDQLEEMRKSAKQVDDSLQIAKIQTTLAEQSSQFAKEALVASQRAWIAPMSVSIETPYVNGKPMKFIVNYQNVGTEPAVNSRWNFALLSVVGNPLNPPPDLGSENSRYCELAKASQSQTSVYPSEMAQYRLYLTRTMTEPLGRILEGKETAYLEGCIRYESYGVARESRFCFLWINDETKNWKEWEWRFCPKGNEGT